MNTKGVNFQPTKGGQFSAAVDNVPGVVRAGASMRVSPPRAARHHAAVAGGRFVGVCCFPDAMSTGTSDRFYDRNGNPIPVERWAQLRGDDDYAVLGEWSDDNGAAVRTVWTGFSFNDGDLDALVFETHCLVGDQTHYYTYRTEDAARAGHDDCVAWISGNPAAPVARPATIPTAPGFVDRRGQSLTLAQWTRLRSDPDYRVLARWHGEGGAYAEVYWVGFDPVNGFHARSQVFGLTVAAFDNCPLPDSTYRFFTEKRALDHFARMLPLIERGIRPWDDDAVEAAGFDPLTLRAW